MASLEKDSETECLLSPAVSIVGRRPGTVFNSSPPTSVRSDYLPKGLDLCRDSPRHSPVLLSVTVDQGSSEDSTVVTTATPGPRYSIQSQDNDTDRESLTGDGTDGDHADNGKPVAHCHIRPKDSGVDKKARFKLVLASLLCLVFMVGEVVGGLLANSLAVVSDAAHLLTDFASFMISLVALYLVSRPATKRLSFGWHRAEILGALVSILLLWVITGILVYSAALRIQSGDYEIDATIMLITSSFGVLFNIVLGCTLHQHGHSHGGHGHSHSHGHSHLKDQSNQPISHVSQSNQPISHVGQSNQDISNVSQSNAPTSNLNQSNPPASNLNQSIPSLSNFNQSNLRNPLLEPSRSSRSLDNGYGSISSNRRESVPSKKGKHKQSNKQSNINVKAAFIHVVGDFCQSVGVLVAALIIYFKPEWKMADPICTFLFSVLVLITTVNIMRDILVVLMEGTPRNLNFEEVRDTILGIEGVRDLHDLRLWSLTMNKTALSVHLAVESGVDPMEVVRTASDLIQGKFNISQTTMQVEQYVPEMNDCTQCQDLKD